MKNKTIMIIAGEASGDIYGAQLAKAISKKSRNINLCGVGSRSMRHAGVDILLEAKKLSVMGITEVISKIPYIASSIKCVKNTMERLLPSLIILIDFPDFNLHVASFAKKLGIPVLYYVSPQLWAWRRSRIDKIRKLTDKVAVILPFEKGFYKKYGISVDFVGHPILDNVDIVRDLPSKTTENNGINGKLPVVGLLPGSRNKEVSRLLPIMLKAAKLIKKEVVSTQFIVSCANSVNSREFNAIIKKHAGSLNVSIFSQPVKQMFSRCDFIVVASGTVSLEVALYGIPTVIVYKLSAVSYLIGRMMVDVKHIGLVNLILGRRVVPELVQWEVTPDNISKIVIPALKDSKILNRIKDQLLIIKRYLGKPGVSDRVANIAISMVRNYDKKSW